MDKTTRNRIQRATQVARKLLEDDYREQLEGTFDILLDGIIAPHPGTHLSAVQRVAREKIVEAIHHKRSRGMQAREAVDAYLREAAFTTLNRFVALKMLEARDLVQECVSAGDDSAGFKEFTALAPGLVLLDDKGYRLYIESLFDEIGQEVRVLFDRHDVASLLWPGRQTLLELLSILNESDLSSVWAEDETIGWVYQYFNGDEERTKMRAESQAPRNSRELAVRNQFFTPRYVVQFLTDNTLGRTWYEMMQGDTRLVHLDYLVRRPSEVFLDEGESAPESDTDDSKLSQEELLQQTVHLPFRQKKDPRDLRILDPACGSGHFLLYTFDLLITIYEEAWADAGAASFKETSTQLRADYQSLDDLRRAIPALILRHNLHGVDIDPRAAQIAALALWMRAQRAYNQFEVDRAHRPPITKTNIVVAEPMPGDAELVDEFAANLKPAVLGDLFKKMVEEMKLSGELGSLLKIEESIGKAVKEASEASQQGGLFAERVESQDFWNTADEKIIEALRSFTESAAGAGGVRRQLFAGDAAQGVAFIELMRKRFDVVLMNPPFGAVTPNTVAMLGSIYGREKRDIYEYFFRRALESAEMVGALTTRNYLYQSRFKYLRSDWLRNDSLAVAGVIEFGLGLLDAATVRPAATVLFNHAGRCISDRTLYVDLRGASEPRVELKRTVSRFVDGTLPQGCTFHDMSQFSCFPGTRFPLSATAGLLNLFITEPSLDDQVDQVTEGLTCDGDDQFIRLWWEVPPESIGKRWLTYAKYCSRNTFIPDFSLLIDWSPASHRLLGSRGNRRANERYYFRGGLALTRSCEVGMAVTLLPHGCVFAGVARYLITGDMQKTWSLLGGMNSEVIEALHAILTPDRDRISGTLRKLPVPSELVSNNTLGDLARQVARAKLLLHSTDETGRYFAGPVDDEAESAKAERVIHYAGIESACLSKLEAEVRDVFGLSNADVAAIDEYLEQRKGDKDVSTRNLLARIQSNSGLEETQWAVGLAFGRWCSVETELEHLTDKGLLIPEMPPALVVSSTGRGLLVDDIGHVDDVLAVVAQVSEQRSRQLGHLQPSWRQLIRKELFGFHVQRYTKAKRRAPIYWQLATPSASYSIWCYYHRLTSDTFFRAANDYISPKVDHEERKLNVLRKNAGPDPSKKQRAEINVQETFVAELRAFLTEVERIAPLWNPNLNDGVIINFAPLWRLVPQHKAWQKECKKVWDKLVKGDYDWAYLAMHLWPERVVPKCAEDRSLAIAHGLEDDFWYEDADGKKTVWKKRQISQDRVEELVVERSSTAVKAALESLLTAPAPSGSSKRRGRKRGGA